MNKLLGLIFGWGLLYLFWWALFGEPKLIPLLAGIFATGGALFLFYRFGLTIDLPLGSIARPLGWLKFFSILIWEIAKSTFWTCYLIVTGGVSGEIVAYDTKLESGYGRLFLINSITLTPTTIGILSEGNLVYIHHINLEGREEYDQLLSKIRSSFEEPLKDLVG